MKYTRLPTLCIVISLMCGCAMFGTKQQAASPEAPKKLLSVPVGKNWQVIEEAPKLTTDGSLPFQKEQSLQPEGASPAPPKGNLEIETPH